jgi:hypothetical protein
MRLALGNVFVTNQHVHARVPASINTDGVARGLPYVADKPRF